MRAFLAGVLTVATAFVFLGCAQVPETVKEKTTVQLVLEVEPALVAIEVSGVAEIPTRPDLPFDHPDQILQEYKVVGKTGTGFILQDEQLTDMIVTNHHVVYPPDGGRWKKHPKLLVRNRAVTMITILRGGDALSDLAVVQILRPVSPSLLDKAGRLPTLKFADPKSLAIGEDVVALGFALNLDGRATVTKGILSAEDRNFLDGKFSGLLQTDAVINHGNSGGPLVNMRGEVVGVSTYAELGRAAEEQKPQIAPVQGIFYARSCQTAEPFVRKLIKDKVVHRASLGAKVGSVSRLDADRFVQFMGVFVEKLDEDSPLKAVKAQVHDVIFQLDKQPIRNEGDLNNVLAFLKPGDTVSLRYMRPAPESLQALKKGQSIDDDNEIVKAMLGLKVKVVQVKLK